MSFFRAHRRATAFLFALTLVTVSTKGLCLMPAVAGEKADAHACCKKGLPIVSPACCMEGHTDQAAATVTARGPSPAPGVAQVSPLGATAPFVPASHQYALDADRRHTPPPRTILRV